MIDLFWNPWILGAAIVATAVWWMLAGSAALTRWRIRRYRRQLGAAASRTDRVIGESMISSLIQAGRFEDAFSVAVAQYDRDRQAIKAAILEQPAAYRRWLQGYYLANSDWHYSALRARRRRAQLLVDRVDASTRQFIRLAAASKDLAAASKDLGRAFESAAGAFGNDEGPAPPICAGP